MYEHWEQMLSGKPRCNPKLINKLGSIHRAGYNAPIYEKWLESGDEKACCDYERFLIWSYGRRDLGLGNLCNLTNGGEGVTGYIFSLKARDKISQGNKARYAIPEERERSRISSQNIMARPGMRERRSKAMKLKCAVPGVKKKKSEDTALSWSNAETRSRRVKGMSAAFSDKTPEYWKKRGQKIWATRRTNH